MSPLWLKHMYSILSALTLKPMPAAAHSRLCCRVLAWAGEFTRSAMSLMQYASVCAGYLLLLFVSLKALSFILSTDILSMSSRQMIKRYGANVSPCSTPATMLKCLHPGSGILLSCFYIVSLWLWRFLWVSHRWVVFAPSSLCAWSQKPWRNQQIILLPVGFYVFCMYTFKNSTNSQNLRCCGSISPKAILVLPKYLLNF